MFHSCGGHCFSLPLCFSSLFIVTWAAAGDPKSSKGLLVKCPSQPQKVTVALEKGPELSLFKCPNCQLVNPSSHKSLEQAKLGARVAFDEKEGERKDDT